MGPKTGNSSSSAFLICGNKKEIGRGAEVSLQA